MSAAVHRLYRPFRHRLPFWRLIEPLADKPHAFLLDSAAPSAKLGRYSYLGADPFLTVTVRRGRNGTGKAEIEVRDRRGALISSGMEDPFELLRSLLHDLWDAAAAQANPTVPPDFSAPFLGGAVGYLGYEAGYLLEDLPDLGVDDLQLPIMDFGFHDTVLVHDNHTGLTFVSAIGRAGSAPAARIEAQAHADQLTSMLDQFDQARFDQDHGQPETVTTNDAPMVTTMTDLATYSAKIEKILQYIRDGDAYEVCLTHRIEADTWSSPLQIYRELRRISPAPFAAYLSTPDATVLSASPERFLNLNTDGLAESRPIKGTRPRGKTPDEDERLRTDLASSEKDRAENTMIVDLVRNDLGRVCEPGSVEVSELHVIEAHPTVFQLVSGVRARLRRDADVVDLIKACFPGGSMTGAPKIAAMQIIDSLEPVKRGIYSGAIGFLDFRGGCDLNIVIRTIVCAAGRVTFGVGGAVTVDSIPDDEYRETLDKARALILALSEACRGGQTTYARHSSL